MSKGLEITENSAEDLKKAQYLLRTLIVSFGGDDGDPEVVSMLELTANLVAPAVRDLGRGKMQVVNIQAANG